MLNWPARTSALTLGGERFNSWKGVDPMNQDPNLQILSAVATQLANGKLTSEEAAKLLNTVARFEERVNVSSDREDSTH